MLLPPLIPDVNTLFEKVKMLLIRQLAYLQMCFYSMHDDQSHSARLGCKPSPGERSDTDIPSVLFI